MRTLSKITVFALFASVLVGFAAPALAYYPTLTAYSSGSDTSITITGGQPDASVVINYTPSGSSLATTITGTTDFNGDFTTDVGSVSSQITATVAGQQVVSNSNNGCTYNCGTSYGLSLSQTSVNLNVGQTTTVTANVYNSYSYGNIYVSSNSNSSVATVSVSGNTLTVYGQSTGSSSITICSNSSSSGCATLYVTVGNSGCIYNSYNNCGTGTISLSQTSVSLSSGQSTTVTAYNYSSGSLYISSNSNSSVVSASVSGSTINLYGLSSGSSSVSVCSNYAGQCATIYVTVNGYSGGGSLSLSQNTVSLNNGQSSTITIYGNGSYYVSNNSNSSVVSATVSGANLYIDAFEAGTANISVCQSGGSSQCVSLYVTVTGNSGSNSLLWFSQNTLNLSSGQSSVVNIYSSNNIGSYYISSNSNSSVVSDNINGNALTIYALNSGSTNITVCQTGTAVCGVLYVNVNGNGCISNCGVGGGLSLSQTSVNLSYGQSMTVNIFGGNGSYYISSNSNSSVVTASVSGSSLYLYGQGNGSTTISVCQNSYGVCATVFVTVGGYTSGGLSLSQTTLNLNAGQTSSVTAYGTGSGYYYISSNSNSSVATASISGNTASIYAITTGSTTVQICQSNSNTCGTLLVVVGNNGGYYGNGGLSFITTSLPVVNIGQYYSYQIQVTGGNPPYYFNVTSGGLPSGLTLSSNGVISGTASYAAQSSFTAQVSDAYGHNATATFTFGGGCSYNCSGSGVSYPGGVLGASTYANGSLISQNSTVYIVYQNLETAFANASAFLGLGFKFSNVVNVGNTGLSSSGYTVSSSNVQHPWGSWIKDGGSTIYFVQQTGLIPVPDWNTFLNNGGQQALIVPANSWDFKLPILSPMVTSDPRLQ